MDLNLLSLFVTAARATSFAQAAHQLALPRSSVSRGIAALERALGAQLFHRTTRQIALTTSGTALYAKLAPQLAALTEILGSVPAHDREPSGELRITTPTVDMAPLPEVLTAFTERYRDIQLDVRVSNRIVDLVAERFDAALRIAIERMPDSTLIARRLTRLDLRVFAAPSYLARAGTPRTLHEAAGHAWVMVPFKLPPPFLAPRTRPRIVADQAVFLCHAIVAGAGLALLPSCLVRDHLAAGRLVRVLPRYAVESGALYFVHAPSRHVPAKVFALRDFLVEHFAAHPLG